MNGRDIKILNIIQQLEFRRLQAKLTTHDSNVLSRAYKIISKSQGEIIQTFYEYIISFRDLRKLLDSLKKDPEILAGTFHHYLLSLFAGNYDESYLLSRFRIGEAHFKIGLPLGWYLSAQENLKILITRTYWSLYQTHHTSEQGLPSPEDFTLSLSRVMMFDLLIATDAYVAIYTSDLESAKIRAEQAVRSKNMFLAAASHDLRSPLFAIVGFSELLLSSQDSLNEEMQHYVQAINRNANSLVTMFNDLLSITKTELPGSESSKQNTNIQKFITEIAEDTRAMLYKKPVSVVTEFIEIENNCKLVIARDSVQRILQNLCNNAVKFTESGKISITVRLDLSNHRLVFLVSDTGTGISPENRDKIFKEFFQVDKKNSQGGSGLGLSLSRQLAESLGGYLILQSSQLNQGSTFEFGLPLVSNDMRINQVLRHGNS